MALRLGCIVQLLVFAGCSEDAEPTKSQPVFAAAGAPAPAPAICGLGQTSCNGFCADLQIDPRNCGQCGFGCATGLCVAGVCACPSNLTGCPSGCTDILTDEQNCGVCGRACAAGEVCQTGQCLAPGALCTPACVGGQVCQNNVCSCPAPASSFCAGACFDTSNTVAHCGKCDAPCATGKLCEAGQCVCPAGQTACDAECADLQLSSQHCGMCGNACDAGETCMAGTCRAPLGADGCSGEPGDLRIQEVAAFQTIKVPLSRGVTAIATAMRPAIIQNRPTLFRVYVTPGSGFMAREFSARVTVTNGTGEDQYFAKQRITKASTDADTASTFQVSVPRDRIGEDTRYSVELVECTPGAGPGPTVPPAAGSGGAGAGGRGGQGGSGGTAAPGAAGPRFPADGDVELAAVDTGILKIRFIPLTANGRTADTSDAGLAGYKEYLEAMYPVDEVQFIIGDPLEVAYPVSWNRVLDQLRALRQRAQGAAEEYYYGLLRPTETFQQFCRGGCTAGVSYIGSVGQTGTRVSLGLAYSDEMSAGIMAHEVGHAHGRAHAPCAPGGIQGVDSRFPHDGASTGVWAYDFRSMKFINPSTTKDIMGYCEPKWISDYTYNALVTRSSMLNEQMLTFTDPATIRAYRVLLLDAEGLSWSEPFPRPDAPFGTAEEADALDASGQVAARVTVYRTTIADNYGFTILVPPPQPGWHAIQLRDAPPLPF